MKVILWITLTAVVCFVIIAVLERPMDDSGDDFNPNIFPFEIKHPKDWCKEKKDSSKDK